ncbi:377_t:CDS:2, partial [Ambispora leptoticha]
FDKGCNSLLYYHPGDLFILANGSPDRSPVGRVKSLARIDPKPGSTRKFPGLAWPDPHPKHHYACLCKCLLGLNFAAVIAVQGPHVIIRLCGYSSSAKTSLCSVQGPHVVVRLRGYSSSSAAAIAVQGPIDAIDYKADSYLRLIIFPWSLDILRCLI